MEYASCKTLPHPDSSGSLNPRTSETQMKAKVSDDPDVAYRTWGIFHIAYDKTRSPWFTTSIEELLGHKAQIRSFFRLLAELWILDPIHAAWYCLSTLWLTVSPAFSLYSAFLVLSAIENDCLEFFGRSTTPHVGIYTYVMCALLSHRAQALLTESKVRLSAHLRSSMLPRVVEASFLFDQAEMHDNPDVFPYPHEYGSFVPGWGILEDFFIRLRYPASIIAEVFVVTFIVWQRMTTDGKILAILTIIQTVVLSFCPTNAVGTGYTFWTENHDYNRLMVLFNLIFDVQYRASLLKDGLDRMVKTEFKRISERLGPLNTDVDTLGWGLPPPCHWDLTRFIILNYPLGIYVTIALLLKVPPRLSSIVIFQYALVTLRTTIDSYTANSSRDSFPRIFSKAHQLYSILDTNTLSCHETQASMNEKLCGDGIDIRTRNLAHIYPATQASHFAVKNCDLHIPSGSVVIINGPNGSGKTTLVKLFAGLLRPSSGDVLANNVPTPHFSVEELRKSTVFAGSSEVIYPVSLRENVIMGLDADEFASGEALDHLVEEAISLAGASDIIARFGYDAVLNPCSVNAFTISQTPGSAALEALNRHSPCHSITLSSGEQQRLTTARAFFKALNGQRTRLIILDEATNFMDLETELTTIVRFREVARRRRQTFIVVTQRSLGLAGFADIVLNMHQGSVNIEAR